MPLPRRAVVAAKRKSQARASDRPLCTVGPLIAAIVGLSIARIARFSACECSFSALYVDAASRWPPPMTGTWPGSSAL